MYYPRQLNILLKQAGSTAREAPLDSLVVSRVNARYKAMTEIHGLVLGEYWTNKRHYSRHMGVKQQDCKESACDDT